MNVLEDYLKIKNHLNLPDDLELHINFKHYTGRGKYRSEFPAVMVDLKDGYNQLGRQMLVHECLHATGLKHDLELGYWWDIPEVDPRFRDTYSRKIMNEIFTV